MRTRLAIAVIAVLLAPAGAHAQAAAPAPPASAAAWTLQWNLRVRNESVVDDAFAHAADATTARMRLGLHGAFDGRWEMLLEGEAIAAAGRANDGSNGHAAWPAVIDAPGAEINQAWLRGTFGAAVVTVGRQRLLAGNQRWLGNSGWRQNEQTFDAAALEWRPRRDVVLQYRWIDRVHRVNGDDALDPQARERALATSEMEIAWSRGPLQLAPYALLHHDRDVAAASTATWGVRTTYDRVRSGRGCRIAADVARQHDHANQPRRFDHGYWLLEPVCAFGDGLLVKAGWEHLGADGTHAVQAPLGTLHAFDGWADAFTVTPPAGLDDRYLGAGGGFGRGRLEWQLAWHDFRAARGDSRYGEETDASLGFPVAKGVRGLAKIAAYRTDGFAHDTRKAWLQLEWTR